MMKEGEPKYADMKVVECEPLVDCLERFHFDNLEEVQVFYRLVAQCIGYEKQKDNGEEPSAAIA